MPAAIFDRPTKDLPGFHQRDLGQRQLSEEFIDRVLRFVSWAPRWDGRNADHITPEVAKLATLLAQASLQFGPEPFVAPADDGSLLLKWDLADGLSVEVFVDGQPWDSLTLITKTEVQEMPIRSEQEFFSFLRSTRATLV